MTDHVELLRGWHDTLVELTERMARDAVILGELPPTQRHVIRKIKDATWQALNLTRVELNTLEKDRHAGSKAHAAKSEGRAA